MKIRLMGAELLTADRQTDGRTEGQMNGIHDETNTRFSQFYERTLKTVMLHYR
jgi:hypothetical protein